MASREHILDEAAVHHGWDSEREPVLRVEAGDLVHLDLRMAGHGQVERGAPLDLRTMDLDTSYHLAGPIEVLGAAPGDTLELELLELDPGDWGWTAVAPGFGLLPDDFPTPFVRYFDLDSHGAQLVPGVRIPIDPFLGTIGTHPGEPAVASVFPPHRGGGNMDTRHLTRNSTLWLPVWHPGALLSCGDPHAAQGDGEVCVTAIECPMRVTLRVGLLHRTISTPRFVTAAGSPASDPLGSYGTMGIGDDLMEGARTAVRGMIELLGSEHGLAPEDAYVLCSLAGDLRILEAVDAGVWNVGCLVPRSVFVDT